MGLARMTPLLQACASRILDDWQGGSRDGYHLLRARLQAESVIDVLRERGYLNDYGVAAARDELGDLVGDGLDRMVKGADYEQLG